MSVLRRRKRERFWEKWLSKVGSVCYYCKTAINRTCCPQCPNQATIDHLVPKSRGGTNAQVNLVWACRKCNEEKRDIRLY